MTQPNPKPPPRAAQDLVVLTKAYELVRELSARVSDYPRTHKFALGDRTLDTTYTVLDLLLEAKYGRDKAALLERANLLLERLRFQLRLAHDLRALTPAALGALARQVDEVGRLVGGWLRQARRGTPPGAPDARGRSTANQHQ
jgi:hypothetical protein